MTLHWALPLALEDQPAGNSKVWAREKNNATTQSSLGHYQTQPTVNSHVKNPCTRCYPYFFLGFSGSTLTCVLVLLFILYRRRRLHSMWERLQQESRSLSKPPRHFKVSNTKLIKFYTHITFQKFYIYIYCGGWMRLSPIGSDVWIPGS